MKMMPYVRKTCGRGLYFDHIARCEYCDQIVVYRATDYGDGLEVSFNIDDPVSEDWHQCLLTPAMLKRRSEAVAAERKPQVSKLQAGGNDEEELERLREEESRRYEQRDQLLYFTKEDWKQWFEEQWRMKHPEWSKEEWERWCQEWIQQVNWLRERRQRYLDEIREWEEKEEEEEYGKENASQYYRGIDELLLWDWNELEQIDKKHEHGQPFYDFTHACAPDLEEHYRQRDKTLRLLMQKRQLKWSQEKVEEWLAAKLGLLNDDGLICDPETEYQYNHKLFGKWLDELDELRRDQQEDMTR
jgi:hypothetical protein